MALAPRTESNNTSEISFLTDVSEERKPLRDQCAPSEGSDLSPHRREEGEDKEREEGKAE